MQAKKRDDKRQASIDTVQSQLETYYAQYSQYPTLANLNNASWRQTYLKNLPASDLADPHWSTKATACTTAGSSVVVATVAKNCYTYQVTNINGTACDNTDKNACAHYTLTALLEGGEKYVKTSLN